ncbi:MAG: 30S ribosomal protein S7 [Candidatus Omnitrophica bacterium]|nr:30S ribosomal protein S7 [Candidatus Omnitrophota bacterium]
MRRRSSVRKGVMPDPKYNNKLVAKFINIIMYRGKKSIAERIVYNSFNIIGDKSKKPPLEIFQKAVDNVRPLLEVKSRRMGGATYQVPIEVKSDRSMTLALRWIKMFAKNRKGKSMEDRLASELLDAYKGEGPAVKKKEDTHKMAEANKAFSHFRW